MLSAETSIGKYPAETVKMMSNIARTVEKQLPYEHNLAEKLSWLKRETDELISYSACQTANSLHAAAVVAFTQSGSTAMRISRYRPGTPILALTPNSTVAGKLLLYWGIRPHLITEPKSFEKLLALGKMACRELGIGKPGDLIIISAGLPIGRAGSTNLLKVERLD
jgi:pyruvate kinase